MLKIKILASGSEGNCYFIGTATTRILIDAGIASGAIETALKTIGESLEHIDALLITHEHGDHAKGLRGIVSGYQMPVYLTKGTRQALRVKLDKCFATVIEIAPEEMREIGDIRILPIPVPHDAAQPVAYVALANSVASAFATDLGCIDNCTAEVLRHMDFLFLEANHDRDGLLDGPYPPALKARVAKNHLNNDQIAAFVLEDLAPSVRNLVLGHISETNNDTGLVHAVARRALYQGGKSSRLKIVQPGNSSQLFTF
jgi:phosphoribosyl 1,2-cyclic phosphodiesterase